MLAMFAISMKRAVVVRRKTSLLWDCPGTTGGMEGNPEECVTWFQVLHHRNSQLLILYSTWCAGVLEVYSVQYGDESLISSILVS